MQSNNQVERKKAFFNFLFFFVITVIVILATVFFSIQVPFEQNNKLREKVAAMERERTLAERFSNSFNVTMGYFESVNKPEQSSEMINAKISQNLAEMTTLISVDSTVLKSLYLNVIRTLYDFQEAKRALRGASYQETSIGELNSKLSQCQSELNALRQTNALLMQER